jgi:hypothetical protein
MFVQYNTQQYWGWGEGGGGASLGYEKKEEAKNNLLNFIC